MYSSIFVDFPFEQQRAPSTNSCWLVRVVKRHIFFFTHIFFCGPAKRSRHRPKTSFGSGDSPTGAAGTSWISVRLARRRGWPLVDDDDVEAIENGCRPTLKAINRRRKRMTRPGQSASVKAERKSEKKKKSTIKKSRQWWKQSERFDGTHRLRRASKSGRNVCWRRVKNSSRKTTCEIIFARLFSAIENDE